VRIIGGTDAWYIEIFMFEVCSGWDRAGLPAAEF
jgi:hypothetical protein